MGNIIAIIDNGLSREVILNMQFHLIYSKSRIREDDTNVEIHSHGSICASIIKKYAPQAEIGSIRILNDDGRGKPDGLLAAIKWCIENKIKLIHLSIGTIQACDIPMLYEVVNEAVENGCIIVAACKNECNVSFPASFNNVIGVRADESLIGQNILLNKRPNGGIEFSAGGIHDVFLSSDMPIYTTPNSNSYAAPVISANVYNLLVSENSNLTYPEIRDKLIKLTGKTNQYSNPYIDTSNYFRESIHSKHIPLVIFHGVEFKSLIQSIARYLLNDNYLPLILSQNVNDCCDGCFYIEDIAFFKDACYAMAEFYSTDIVLAAVNENNFPEINPEVIITNYNEVISNSNSIIIHANGASHEELYKQLINKLENDC